MANVEESDVAAECEYRKEKGVAKWHEKFLVEYRGGRISGSFFETIRKFAVEPESATQVASNDHQYVAVEEGLSFAEFNNNCQFFFFFFFFFCNQKVKSIIVTEVTVMSPFIMYSSQNPWNFLDMEVIMIKEDVKCLSPFHLKSIRVTLLQ